MIDIKRQDGRLKARGKLLADYQEEFTRKEYVEWLETHDETLMEDVVLGQDAEGNDIVISTPVNVFIPTVVTDEMLTEYLKPLYAELRESEYPPMAMYLDAVVKGDEEQKAEYVRLCEAVKEKYPKP